MQENKIPNFAIGARLQFDKVRDQWIVLAPEKAISLDAIATAILQEVDGKKSILDIAIKLASKYEATKEQILSDTIQLFQELIDKRIIDLQDADS